MTEAIARQILANALEVMSDEGVTDETVTRETMGLAITLAIANPTAVDADDVVKLALGLIGGHRGGPDGIAAWAEELAASIRNDPDAAPPTVFN
ncbi:MAG: hypothetical protein RID42_17270 [Alphaproteobacteria bacterium]|tara:strand:+ start:118 stop:399 length:282 start_codon:yes stop_codon:yes gene_type:complete